MTIQQAIEKAVESGYDAPVLKVVAHFKEEQKYADVMTEVMMVRNVYPAIFLDPLFWQSLGKAMGWGREAGYGDDYMEGWKYSWFCFIDHLAEGKDAESFFETL